MTLSRRTLVTLTGSAALTSLLVSADCSSARTGSTPASKSAGASTRPAPPMACWKRSRWYGFFESEGQRVWPAPKPTAALFFVKLDTPFSVERLDAYSRRGLTPILSVEPWLQNMLLKDLANPAYTLAAILRGDLDAPLRRIAAVVAAYRGPVLIRWAHEANGDWYPWCLGVNGNTARQYRQVWHKVRAMFPSNAQWVWSVNKVMKGEPYDVAGMYPGDAECDYVGFTAYPNYWTPDVASTWDHTQAVLAGITKKKSYIITETGVSDDTPGKGAWIASMGEYLRKHPRIKGLVWFDFNRIHKATADYGLNTPAQRTAFTAAMKRAGF